LLQCPIVRSASFCNFVRAEFDMTMRLETCDFWFEHEVERAIHAMFADARNIGKKMPDFLHGADEHFVVGTIGAIVPQKLSKRIKSLK
jgi:hypothetical protein